MEITLHQATEKDAAAIHELQFTAFLPLLEKYKDVSTSPATESLEKTISRITNPSSRYFKILAGGELAGAIHIIRKKAFGSLWISPIFIGPTYQGKGIAQKVMTMAEQEYADDRVWELSTLAEETGNCYLYEKLGYKRTDKFEIINEHTTLVYYKKEMK